MLSVLAGNFKYNSISMQYSKQYVMAHEWSDEVIHSIANRFARIAVYATLMAVEW